MSDTTTYNRPRYRGDNRNNTGNSERLPLSTELSTIEGVITGRATDNEFLSPEDGVTVVRHPKLTLNPSAGYRSSRFIVCKRDEHRNIPEDVLKSVMGLSVGDKIVALGYAAEGTAAPLFHITSIQKVDVKVAQPAPAA